MKKTLTAIVFMYLNFQSLSVFAADNAINKKLLAPINVINAVVYVPLGNTTTTTAFFTIQNGSTTDVGIIKVSSPSVKKISLVPIPLSALVSTRSTSSKEPAIEKSVSPITDTSSPWTIQAGKTLTLNPQHQYLQLIGLKNSLTTGDELQLEVSLSNGKNCLLSPQPRANTISSIVINRFIDSSFYW